MTSNADVGQNSQQPSRQRSDLSSERQANWWISSSVDESKIHGFDDEAASLVHMLLRHGTNYDDEFRAIAVVGQAGVGKTTICRLILSRSEVKKKYVPRILLRLPHEADGEAKATTVERILKRLGTEETIVADIKHRRGISGLLCALRKQLEGKRYLIVLDDAASEHGDPWYEELNSRKLISCVGNIEEHLAYGLPKESGGAIIVTSRDEEISKKMLGSENLYQLLPRSDPESCWSIFKDTVENGGNGRFEPSNMSDLKKQILDYSGGVPMVVKEMGLLLRRHH